MSSIVQKFLKYSVALFILIIVILLITPLFISLESYKKLASDKVKEITGRELQINGDISISLLPIPTIIVKDLTLASLDGANYPSLLDVKEVSASISILSLIKGKIDISTIEINQPVINLERMSNGLASWEFAKIPTNVSTTPTDKMNDSKAPFSLYINLIKIVNAKLNYVDFTDKTKGNNASPTTIDIDRLKIKYLHGPSDLSCKFSSSGKNYNIKGNIQDKQGIISLTADLNALQEKVNFSGNFAYDNMTFAGQLKLEGTAKNLQSIFPDMSIPNDLDHKLTFNVNSDKKLLKISDIDFTVGKLLAKGNANFHFQDNKVDLKIKLLDKTFSLATSFAYLDQNLSLNNLNFTVNKANLTGNVGVKDWDKELVVSYNVKISEIAAIASLFGMTLPINLGDIWLKGETVKQQNKQQNSLKTNINKFTVQLKKNPINLSGVVTINLASAKPNILSDITIASLNLDDLSDTPSPNMAANSVQNVNHSVVDNSVPWSKDVIDLSFLNKFDGNLTLTIQKIIKGNLNFDNVKTNMLLAGGVLDIKSINGNLYGGTLFATGQISSQVNQPVSFKATLKDAKLKNIVSQNIASQGSKIKVTQGTVNFVTDIKTKGQSQSQYVGNLFGTATLTASDGIISGFDLQKLLDNLRNIKNLATILKMLDVFLASGETNFQKLAVDSGIKEGVVNIINGKLDVASSEVTITGNVNLPKYTLDMDSTINVNINSIPPLKVHLYGNLNNPQHKLDAKALKEYLTKNLVNSVVDGVKKGTKPEDLLKNIIGGRKNKQATGEETQNNQQREPSNNKDPINKVKSTIEKGLKGLFK
ncbi:AsmA family protein [Rickettsia endosymbiont of Culicoides newsteadi]|uniref:AsmA family protein n=1 Tax=Rickettsia endosymbiont of Culicoides newsteadi TaxID=1961830 RepID=UPI000B9B913C|nr:AsmA family protein [Rickettsia endosymbiont of Culicoides newsteadi]OZG31593.1 membrane protein [Rickettsia endosymbiont of Culicoides newsteadi]